MDNQELNKLINDLNDLLNSTSDYVEVLSSDSTKNLLFSCKEALKKQLVHNLNSHDSEGLTPLIRACLDEDLNKVVELVTLGADPNIPSKSPYKNNLLPIGAATNKKNSEIVRFLLPISKGCDINFIMKQFNPLIKENIIEQGLLHTLLQERSSSNNDSKITNDDSEVSNNDSEVTNNDSKLTNNDSKLTNTSYEFMTDNKDLLCIKETGIIGSSDRSMKDHHGNTVFHYLALSGKYKTLKEEIVTFYGLKKYEGGGLENYTGASVWHYLALSGNFDALLHAINSEGLVNKDLKTYTETSLWHYLAWSGNYEAVKQAINLRLCNKDITDKYNRCLWHFIARSGNYDALKQVIFSKNIYIFADIDGSSIWHYLALSGNYDSLKQALNDKLCDKNITNKNGASLLHFLALSGNRTALQQALQEKLIPNTLDNMGRSIWHYFAWSGNYNGL